METSTVNPQERDVLEGGFWNILFPSYGGAGYRGLIRVILFFHHNIWLIKTFIYFRNNENNSLNN